MATRTSRSSPSDRNASPIAASVAGSTALTGGRSMRDGGDVVGGLDADRAGSASATDQAGGVVLRSGVLGGALKFAGGFQPLLPMISMTSAMFSTSSS